MIFWKIRNRTVKQKIKWEIFKIFFSDLHEVFYHTSALSDTWTSGRLSLCSTTFWTEATAAGGGGGGGTDGGAAGVNRYFSNKLTHED